ncbi:DUF3418 domain-containing protein [Cupriavidus basilensis]
MNLLAQEIARLVGAVLAEYATLPRKLVQAKPFATAHADMQAQLTRLMGKNFVADTPYQQLVHFPRYLKGIAMRIDKIKGDPARDTQRAAGNHAAAAAMAARRDAVAAAGAGVWKTARLDEFRWMLEELRIALFAQELRTPVPDVGEAAAKGVGGHASAEDALKTGRVPPPGHWPGRRL